MSGKFQQSLNPFIVPFIIGVGFIIQVSRLPVFFGYFQSPVFFFNGKHLFPPAVKYGDLKIIFKRDIDFITVYGKGFGFTVGSHILSRLEILFYTIDFFYFFQVGVIDIYGFNAYRGKEGFGALYRDVKFIADKPVVIFEYGCPSYSKYHTPEETELLQAEYHLGCWKNIIDNRAGFNSGNSIGGFAYEWVDEWWKGGGNPFIHEARTQFAGPFPDGYM